MSTTTTARKPASKTPAKARPTRRKASAAKTAAQPAAAPAFDVQALLEKARLPSLDVSGLIDARRRDIDALLEANAQAYRGLEALNRRQAQILADTLKQLRAGAKEFMAEEGATRKAGKASELAQRAFGQALSHMKEVAEAATQAQQDMLAVLKKRQAQRMAEFQKHAVKH